MDRESPTPKSAALFSIGKKMTRYASLGPGEVMPAKLAPDSLLIGIPSFKPWDGFQMNRLR
jgi:hypothetical protein